MDKTTDKTSSFEWFNPKEGMPTVSIAKYGITFMKNTVAIMGNPEYIKLGYDKVNNIVGICICSKNDECKIKFSDKVNVKYIRINSKSFIDIVNSSNNRMYDNNTYRYAAEWDYDKKLLTVDLNKHPLNECLDDEE